MTTIDRVVGQTRQGAGLLHVYVQPRSSRNRICNIHGDALKVAITAPPVEGKANKAIIRFFAKLFGVAPKDVVLVAGEQSRSKTLQFPTVGEQQIKDQLQQHLES